MRKEEDIYINSSGKIFVSDSLIETIKSFPVTREVEHCDLTFTISPFDFYGICPKCNAQIKVRSFSANHEIEDLFDAVFEWLINPEAQKIVQKR